MDQSQPTPIPPAATVSPSLPPTEHAKATFSVDPFQSLAVNSHFSSVLLSS